MQDNESTSHALARNDDPETAHDAARSLEPHVARMEREVLTAIALAMPSGACASELAHMIGIGRDSVSPRLPRLVEKGKIVDSGERRKWGSHRPQIVWRLAPEAQS